MPALGQQNGMKQTHPCLPRETDRARVDRQVHEYELSGGSKADTDGELTGKPHLDGVQDKVKIS